MTFKGTQVSLILLWRTLNKYSQNTFIFVQFTFQL